jgi:hypothetical protein
MSKNIRRRANRFYVQSGPEQLVRPATREEIEAALVVMKRQQHVNRNIVASHLTTLPQEWPLTVIELMFLQSSEMGIRLDRFAARHGVDRAYAYDKDATPV